LAREFLRRFNASNGTELHLDASACEALLAHPFPGNVRELENCVHRAASLAKGPVLGATDFQWLNAASPLTRAPAGRPPQAAAPARTPDAPARPQPARKVLAANIAEDPARARLIGALERTGWVQAKAARLLGLTPRQIAYALHKYQIQVRKF
jgi:Nif-specific regulatory protein